MSGTIKKFSTQASITGKYWFNTGAEKNYEYSWTPQSGEMMSISHPNHPFSGGPWLLKKTEDLRSISNGRVTGMRRYVDGQFVLGEFSGNENYPPEELKQFTESEVKGYGTTAIARTEPTDSEWSAATFLGELRNGAPSAVGSSLFKDRSKLARSAGSEYLNVEFGWKPMVADVKAFLKAVTDADDIMSQYRRDSGRKIRRRTAGPVESSTSTTQGRFVVHPTNHSTLGFAQGVRVRTNERRQWFSGAFKYYLPETASSTALGDFALKARRLHGVELTPEVVWNLAPWSWAADWFGNTGDVMHNISALGRDGLVLLYGYSMASRTGTIRDVATLNKGPGYSLTRVQRDTSKTRVPASPYGFEMGWEDLSPRQLAITAALGLTKT